MPSNFEFGLVETVCACKERVEKQTNALIHNFDFRVIVGCFSLKVMKITTKYYTHNILIKNSLKKD
jgi:hypothetical protein